MSVISSILINRTCAFPRTPTWLPRGGRCGSWNRHFRRGSRSVRRHRGHRASWRWRNLWQQGLIKTPRKRKFESWYIQNLTQYSIVTPILKWVDKYRQDGREITFYITHRQEMFAFLLLFLEPCHGPPFQQLNWSQFLPRHGQADQFYSSVMIVDEPP